MIETTPRTIEELAVRVRHLEVKLEAAAAAVSHLLRQISVDENMRYHAGPGTRALELLVYAQMGITGRTRAEIKEAVLSQALRRAAMPIVLAMRAAWRDYQYEVRCGVLVTSVEKLVAALEQCLKEETSNAECPTPNVECTEEEPEGTPYTEEEKGVWEAHVTHRSDGTHVVAEEVAP